MKSPRSLRVALFALSLLLTLPASVRGQNSSLGSFTYQGRLNDTSGPANGLFDFQFSLHSSGAPGPGQIGTTISSLFLPVTNGLFTVTLNFPELNNFNGADRWLQISVKPGGVPTNYTLLSPRQQITSAPYAIRAANAGTVAGVNINSSLSSTALGLNTTASGPSSTALGESTVAGGPHSTAMGRNTLASGGSSTAMGEFSQANGNFSTAMGYGTRASGTHSTAMGWGSEAAGNFSMASGYASKTAGERSFAAGTLAYATNEGSFVWADASAGTGSNAAFGSTGTNQFVIRATGGVGINTNNPNGAALAVNGDMTVNGNFKGGYSGNSVGAGTEGAVIAGGGASGFANSIGLNSDYSAIGGGYDNNIASNSWNATIVGGAGNDIGVESYYTAIGGGGNNEIAANSFNATIAGGDRNDIGMNSPASAIGGGVNNNIADNSSATIAGGVLNDIGVNSSYSAIGGGYNNNIAASSWYATIAGGVNNDIGVDSDYSAIGGGLDNNIAANAQYAVIPGGFLNEVGAGATNAFAAGHRAKANHPGTFVWGDSQNADFASTANNQFLIRAAGGVAIGTNDPAGAMLRVAGSIKADSFLGMGTTLMLGTTDNQPLQLQVSNTVGLRLEYPTVGSVPNLVGGYSGNNVGAGTEGAVIAGGGSSGFANSIGVNSDYSAIGGGFDNNIAPNSSAATIAGGAFNDISADSDYSAIGGGRGNNIASNSPDATIAGGLANGIGVYSWYSTIGGGNNNNISSNSWHATIAGGVNNDIGVNSYFSAIGGGADNNIASDAQSAVIPGGLLNDVGAGASFAFAAGHRAKANHPGTFVWGDSTDADFASTANNQFSIRASGGLRLSDSTSMEFGATPRQMLNLWSTNYGIGVQASSLYFRCNNAAANDGFIWYKGGTHNDAYAEPGAGGTELMHLVQGGLYVNGALVSTSDRNAKENFQPVDAKAVLEKVAALPLSRWNYKQDPGTRHLGPMAQDFHAAFGVGPDDKHIATVDADGVALAAIQGLNRKVEEKEARIQAFEKELTALKELVAKLSTNKD